MDKIYPFIRVCYFKMNISQKIFLLICLSTSAIFILLGISSERWILVRTIRTDAYVSVPIVYEEKQNPDYNPTECGSWSSEKENLSYNEHKNKYCVETIIVNEEAIYEYDIDLYTGICFCIMLTSTIGLFLFKD